MLRPSLPTRISSLALALVLINPATDVFAEVIRVEEGQSIQEAVQRSKKGDIIEVMPGTYRESIYIDKEWVHLRGVIVDGQWPTLDGEGEKNDALISSGSNFIVENLHVRRYLANGVTTQGANNVVMRHLMVEDTGLYGIYPTLGSNIVVEDTVSWGIADAAIYVGQCNHVDVRRNEVFESVAGIESENSEYILIEENFVHNNAGGILIFALPGLPRKTSAHTIIRHNFVMNNNHHNFAEVGSIVGTTPPGSGIILLATDDVLIEKNIIRNNSTAGITLSDHDFLPNVSRDPKVDPEPDRVRIRNNLMSNNGHKGLRDYANWFHYLVQMVRGSGIPEGAMDQILPDGGDLYVWGKGKESCAENLAQLTGKLRGYLVECDAPLNDEPVVSMAALSEGQPDLMEGMGLGERTYAAVCAGCHSDADRVIGPPMDEVRRKYGQDRDRLVAFAKNPQKVRSGYPPMPSQAYLGDEKLKAVAEFILGRVTPTN